MLDKPRTVYEILCDMFPKERGKSMNKSEIAEKAAREALSKRNFIGLADVPELAKCVERAIAESRGQPESGCADNDPERDCKCGGERGKPSCAFPADRPTPTCQNCGWYLFSDTCDRCGASRPEIPCICREGLNNQLCQRHGAIAESQAPQARAISNPDHADPTPAQLENSVEPDDEGAAKYAESVELGDGEPSPNRIREALRQHWPHQVICDHEAKKDAVACSCALWIGTPQPSVGQAIEKWIDHVFAESGAAQEVSPPSPDSNPIQLPCGCEYSCRGHAGQAEGDTRELKVALSNLVARLKIVMAWPEPHFSHDLPIEIRQELADAEKEMAK